MDDISREPLPEGQRLEGGGRKGPAEVVRLDESRVDEVDVRRVAESDRSATEGRIVTARTFETARLAPPVPLRFAPFAAPGEDVPVAPRPAIADARPGDASGPSTSPDEEPEAPREGEGEPARDEDAPDETAAAGDPPVPGDAPTDPVAGTDTDAVEVDAAEDDSREVPEVDELAADEEADIAAAEAAQARAEEEFDDSAPPLTDPSELSRVLLAVLLSSREPLKLLRLAEICNSTQQLVGEALDVLSRDLCERGFPLEVLRTDDAVRLMTAPVVFPYLERLRKARKAERLSPAALETLAVIAYRQPVIRAEIEAIRGVKVGPVMRSLLEHKLVKVVGRADVPGRPLQYGTTQHFLDRFGLNSLKDLPSVQEFRSLG